MCIIFNYFFYNLKSIRSHLTLKSKFCFNMEINGYRHKKYVAVGLNRIANFDY